LLNHGDGEVLERFVVLVNRLLFDGLDVRALLVVDVGIHVREEPSLDDRSEGRHPTLIIQKDQQNEEGK
jgi:hypothetical protein